VLTVGRWMSNEKYKGLDHLVAAMSILKNELPDLRLVAIGSGDDLNRIRTMARDDGLGDRVQFLSSVSRPELASYYAHCDLFALPSAGEGFGLVFLEAMAFGKSVIGGAHGGTPDVVEDGKTGYLVRHGDLPQLCGAIRRLIENETLRRKLGERGRDFVQRNFLFEHFQSRLTQLLDTCGS
jgi:phosphatidyl-myo-inositol dimannoside synthase